MAIVSVVILGSVIVFDIMALRPALAQHDCWKHTARKLKIDDSLSRPFENALFQALFSSLNLRNKLLHIS